MELAGQGIGHGGVLFHYNVPHGDIYLEVAEPYRRRGFGAWLVQELKCAADELGAVPCTRCSPTNRGSRSTLLKAGFVPFAHILTGVLGKGAKDWCVSPESTLTAPDALHGLESPASVWQSQTGSYVRIFRTVKC